MKKRIYYGLLLIMLSIMGLAVGTVHAEGEQEISEEVAVEENTGAEEDVEAAKAAAVESALNQLKLKKHSGWAKVEGTWYYFLKGVMQTGWQKVNGYWYYMNTEGQMQTGWQDIGNNTCYFRSSGEAVSGWQTIEEKRYFFDSSCYLCKGEHTMNRVLYVFDAETGELLCETYTPWEQKNGYRYYYDSNGKMATGWRMIDGHWYLFASTGRMLTGWQKMNGYWYYMNADGQMLTGWQDIGKYTCYFRSSGEAVSGWQTIDGKKYYFDASCYLCKGEYTMNRGVYVFDEVTGELLSESYTPWEEKNGYKYYYDRNGKMATGWKFIDGYWYLFASTGRMLTGWQKMNGYWYYMNADGQMLTGWQNIGKYTCYFRGSGEAVSGWQTIEGKKYYFDISCYLCKGTKVINGITHEFDSITGEFIKRVIVGWYKENGSWYYYDKDSNMLTGWQYISGYKYYLGEDGRMYEDLRDMVSGPYYIRVNKQQNCVTVYAKDGEKGFTIPVVAFVCSGGEDTPLGTFYTPAKYRWHTLMGPSYGQWCTRITGGILFHSVYYNSYNNNMSLAVGEYNKLGKTASHGCVRLTAGDAKWIYDNCELGTRVNIYNASSAGPLGKPTALKLASSHKWDPTDPIAYAKCRQLGCH